MIGWITAALSALADSISLRNSSGLAAIFFITVSCDIGIPFPFALDTILFFTTYRVGALSLPVLLIVLMIWGGRMVGTGLVYWLSRLLGPRLVNWLGRRSRFLERNLQAFQNRLSKWPVPIIIAGRLTPGFMQVSSIAAGTTRLPYYQVVLAIVLSSVVYDGTLVLLGTLARLGFRDVNPEDSGWIVLGFVGIMVLIFVAVHLARRKSKY